MFSEKELNLEESVIREQVNELPDAARQEYQALINAGQKSPSTYGKLNILCLLGSHHFYLKRWLRGSISLSTTCIALYLLFSMNSPTIAASILLANFIVEIPQMLNIAHIVHAYNIRVMQQSLDRVRNSLP
ncbi:MAG: hypothetical protein R3332_11420 [Pseudohongiellaceae bacterium]|nr:hypothetical protein [Pseudohongiellaceae bacterium]